jgi:3-oxoacyl-[acyl-carrier-protein] synthase II
MSADAEHITAPSEDGAGAVQAIRMALHQAGLPAQAVDYINAHGTSTPLNDGAETVAVKSAIEEAAYRVKISATKSQIGHLLGAAGSVEAIATLLSMEYGFIPATLNYEHPDPKCDLDYTPQSVAMPIEVALSNSFGFGGQNAALLFRKMK